MARKAMADLAAHVSINTVDARASISLLKRNIRELNQEWKSEYHAELAAGHGADAMKAKAHGLIQVQNALKETLSKVNNAISNSSGEKGSQAYRKTTLDAKQLQNQLIKNQAQVQNNNRVMQLHSDELNRISNQERYNREITDANVQTYKNEGNSIEANRLKLGGYSRELSLLAEKRKQLAQSLDNYRNSGGDTTGNRDYEHTLVELQRVKSLEEQVKNEQHDLNSGLTDGVKYDDLYNQSTNKVIASLKGMKQNAEANRIEYQRLTGNIDREAHTLDAEKAKVDRIAHANITASDATGHQSIAFQKENAKLSALNATYNQHVYRIGRLSKSYGALSASSTASIDRMQHKINDLNASSNRWLNSARAMTGPSLALGAAFLYGSKQAIGLENQFNYVRNLLNTSGETYRQSTREIHEMGRATAQYSMEYGVSQRQIAKGYTDLVKRGYSGRQALASQKTYLQGAIASGDKYSDVMDTAASTLEAFGMRSTHTRPMFRNTKIAVNELAYAADKTATDFKGIGYGMKFTGATAHSANQSLSETSSALGILSNNGQNATNAGFGLRKVLNSFIAMKDTKSWKKILPQLGLSAKDFQTANGHLKSLSDMMALLQSHTRKLSDAQRVDVFHQLFGATGQESALILARNTGNLAQLNDQVARSQDQDKNQGYAARIANKNMNSTQNQLERLKQAGVELSKEYAQGLNPEFKRFSKIALGLATHLSKAPKPVKDFVATVSLAVPVFTALGFALGGIQRAYSTFYQIQQRGILGFLRNTDNAKQNSMAITDNTAKLNAATLAQRQNNAAKQQGKNIDNEQSISLDKDSASEKTNATATDTDTTSERNNSTSLKGNIASRGALVEANAGSHLKSGAINGAMIGGTEALSGDPKGGAKDAIGVTGGALIGGALGDMTGNPAIGAIGSALGQAAGPEISNAIADKLGPVANKMGRALDKHNSTKNGDMRNTIRNKEDNPKVQAATIKDLNARKTALGRLFSGASTATLKFVNSEARDERKAEVDYVTHRGKMTKAQRGYFNSMYKTAAAYERRQTRSHQAELKRLYKDGDLTKREYQRESSMLKRHENNKLNRLKRDEKNVLKASNKSHSVRLKALRKFNSDIAKETNASNRKQLKLKRYLDNHVGKLDSKAYTKIMNASKRAYRNTVANAKRGYDVKRKSAQREYRLDLSDARKRFGVHSRMYARIEARARTHEARQIRTAASQANRTESHAKRQENGVINDANHQASSAVRSAYREDHESTGILSSMASTVGSIFRGMAHMASAIGHADMHRRANGTPDTQALHLAIGNLPGLAQNENAIINDGSGRELVKLPNGQLVLPSGRNVHTILPKGTSVFNAIDTRKILSILHGSLGKELAHFASGSSDTTGFAGMAFPSSISGNSIGDLSGTADKTKHSMGKIHDLIDSGYQKAADDANGHLQDLDTNSDQSWQDVYEKTKQHVKDIHKDTSSRFGDLMDWLDKAQAHSNSKTYHHLDTTVRYFKSHFGMISPITGKSMKHGTSIINAGIRAIDKVLKQFGGNSHVLDEIHFATGTSTPMMNKQLAVVNDATSGPAQEAIVSQSGKVRMPRGRNVVTALNPGDSVLNGSDTKYAIEHGLLPHYKFGLKSAMGLLKLFKNFYKSPTHFAEHGVTEMTREIGNQFTRGAEEMVRKGSMKPAIAWSNALWSVIHSLIHPASSTSSSSLLSEAHKLGDGHEYDWGAAGPKYYDCGGLVMAALHHLGVDQAQHTAFYRFFPKIPESEATTGDIVESAKHVGIVADPHHRTYFSAYGPNFTHSIETQPLDNAHFTPGYPYHFLRVPELAKRDATNQQHSKKVPFLMKLIKRELGRKAMRNLTMIGHLISDFMGGGANQVKGSDVISRAWNEFSKLGMTPTQIAAVIGGAKQEAGPDFSPTAYDPDGGLGLFQITPHASGVNLRTWAASRGLDWKDPAVQAKCYYEKFLKPSGYLSTNGSLMHEAYEAASVEAHSAINGGLPGNSNLSNREAGAREIARWYKSHGKGYANGGLSVSDKLAHISEGNNPEMVLPLTDRSRAVELMLKSLQYMFGQNNQSNNNNQINANDQQLIQKLISADQKKTMIINKMFWKLAHIDETVPKDLKAMQAELEAIINKPVLTRAQIYKANRDVTMKKLRLRNFGRGTF